jgi:hypothetical protein
MIARRQRRDLCDLSRSALGAYANTQTFRKRYDIVVAPAMTDGECDGNGLRIPSKRQLSWLSKEPLEVFVDVQLLDQQLHQRSGPVDALSVRHDVFQRGDSTVVVSVTDLCGRR